MKKTKLTKMFSLVLSMMIILCAFPMTAFAEEPVYPEIINYTGSIEGLDIDGTPIDYSGSEYIEVTEPMYFDINLTCLNSEQTSGMFREALDYEVKILPWTNYVNSNTPDSTTDGEHERMLIYVPQELIDSNDGIYTIDLFYRAVKYPNVPVQQLGQTLHISITGYRLNEDIVYPEFPEGSIEDLDISGTPIDYGDATTITVTKPMYFDVSFSCLNSEQGSGIFKTALDYEITFLHSGRWIDNYTPTDAADDGDFERMLIYVSQDVIDSNGGSFDLQIVIRAVERPHDELWFLGQTLHLSVTGYTLNSSADDGFKLVDSLKNGDEVILYNPSNGVAVKNEALNNNWYLGTTEITPADGVITTDDSSVIWTVSSANGKYTFSNGTDSIAAWLTGSYLELSNDTALNAADATWTVGDFDTAEHTHILGTAVKNNGYLRVTYKNVDGSSIPVATAATSSAPTDDDTYEFAFYVKRTETAHEHEFSTEWTKNETAHWHECTAEDCDIEDYAACGFEGAAYGTHVDANGDFRCDVCGYYDEAGYIESLRESFINDITDNFLPAAKCGEAKDLLAQALEDLETAATVSEINSIYYTATGKANSKDAEFANKLSGYKNTFVRELKDSYFAGQDNYIEKISAELECCTSIAALDELYLYNSDYYCKFYKTKDGIVTSFNNILNNVNSSDAVKALAQEALDKIVPETDYDAMTAASREYNQKIDLQYDYEFALVDLLAALESDEYSEAVKAIIREDIAALGEAESTDELWEIYEEYDGKLGLQLMKEGVCAQLQEYIDAGASEAVKEIIADAVEGINACETMDEVVEVYGAAEDAIAEQIEKENDITAIREAAIAEILAAAEKSDSNFDKALVEEAINVINAAENASDIEYFKKRALGMLENNIIEIYFDPATDVTNTYQIAVKNRANMVQFMELDHGTGTRSFDRYNDNVTIVSFDAEGNVVSSTSKDLAYEVWTITTPLANGNVGVRVKAEGSSRWDDASKAVTFDNAYDALDSGIISAALAKTEGSKGAVKVSVAANADTKIVQLKNKEGETFTFDLSKATENADGTLTFNGSVYFHGTAGTENIATVRYNDAYGWHDTDVTVEYTIK